MNTNIQIQRHRFDNQFWVDNISRIVMIIFLYASITKLFQQEQFADQLGEIQLFAGTATVLAWLIPVVELMVCGLLLFNMSRLVGLAMALGLLGIYTLYLLIKLNYAGQLPYADASLIGLLGWKGTLSLNLVLIALSYLAILLRLNASYYKF